MPETPPPFQPVRPRAEGGVWGSYVEYLAALEAEAEAANTLVTGLRKATKDDETEWVDANIIRLLLDRYVEQSAPTASEVPDA